MLCVFYYNNAWHVGAFGVYTKYVHPSVDIIKTFTPKGGKYRGFFKIGFVCCSYKMQNASTTRYL